MAGFVVLCLLAAVVAWPLVAEGMRSRTPGRDDATSEDKFADLPSGRTRYRLFGPENGELVVCVHGLTAPGVVWEPVANLLAESGYRVLLYDLYGRGFSDSPKGAQDARHFATQLDEMLACLNVTGPFFLAGYSMGGSIVAAFSASAPDRVRKLFLLAPSGFVDATYGLMRFCRDTPVLGDWVFLLLYPRIFRRDWSRYTGSDPMLSKVFGQMLGQLDRRGFLGAVLSSKRNILRRNRREEHRKLKHLGLETMALWGDKDTTIPIAAKSVLEEWNPDARHQVLPGATHSLCFLQAQEVACAMIAFFRSDPAPS